MNFARPPLNPFKMKNLFQPGKNKSGQRRDANHHNQMAQLQGFGTKRDCADLRVNQGDR
jgi:hypothetical protein